MLIVFAGLPATGKTTISRSLAQKLNAVYLRIDTIEQALIHSGEISRTNLQGAGYFVAYAVAKDHLKMKQTVISDSVNSISITRNAWKQVAIETQMPIFNIEIICSDQAEHRKRVETRQSDIENLKFRIGMMYSFVNMNLFSKQIYRLIQQKLLYKRQWI